MLFPGIFNFTVWILLGQVVLVPRFSRKSRPTDYFKHCKETSKLELERRFGRLNRVEEVLNNENDEDNNNEEFNDENDSGYGILLCIF